MKISNLISFLDRIRNKHGNLEIVKDHQICNREPCEVVNVCIEEGDLYVDEDNLALHIE